MALPKVSLLSLGGTIAMAPRPHGAGVAPTLSADDLVASVPQLEQLADISARSLISIPGADLTRRILFSVADEVVAETCRGACGVVVVQGTDTMEETAFLLDLLLDTDAPVVPPGRQGSSCNGTARIADLPPLGE